MQKSTNVELGAVQKLKSQGAVHRLESQGAVIFFLLFSAIFLEDPRKTCAKKMTIFFGKGAVQKCANIVDIEKH